MRTLPADERESLHGPQARADSRSYRVWHKTDAEGGPAGKYLVDDAGQAVWLVDPGINGVHNTRPDGTEVRKFDAPKATLMSYIIKGILDRKLPWGLVLFGVMIALVLEMCGDSRRWRSRSASTCRSRPRRRSSSAALIRWLVDRARCAGSWQRRT